MQNGGVALDVAPPPPRTLRAKLISGVAVVLLTLAPCLYLLLFGLQQGKAATKAWWVSTMTGLALGALIYEPFAIFVQFVLLPSVVRHKIKQLIDPTKTESFPFRTAMHEVRAMHHQKGLRATASA